MQGDAGHPRITGLKKMEGRGGEAQGVAGPPPPQKKNKQSAR
jgi:hypothetical protein